MLQQINRQLRAFFISWWWHFSIRVVWFAVPNGQNRHKPARCGLFYIQISNNLSVWCQRYSRI